MNSLASKLSVMHAIYDSFVFLIVIDTCFTDFHRRELILSAFDSSKKGNVRKSSRRLINFKDEESEN